jgi:hypothetical protein
MRCDGAPGAASVRLLAWSRSVCLAGTAALVCSLLSARFWLLLLLLLLLLLRWMQCLFVVVCT